MKKGKNNRITLLISSLSGGGAERVTCNLANYLFKKGFTVDVITLSNKNDTYKLNDGVRRINLLDNDERRGKILNILTEWKRLRRYVDENVNVSCYITMLPINSFMLVRLKRKIRGKIIASDRVNPASYGYINRFMMKYVARNSDGFVVQTDEIKRWYKKIKNIEVIPNAINKDIKLSKDKKTEKKFVAVGRLSEQKNYPMLIKAFSVFSRKHPDYILEIYGQGKEENALKEIVKKEKLNDKVIFKGYVNDVANQISNATGFVMASNNEGMSNALIEAMCIGLPCVVTDSGGGGARELINNNENGILIKRSSIDEMVLGMNAIVEDSILKKKLSNNAKKLKLKLDPDLIYDKWLNYIKKITD